MDPIKRVEWLQAQIKSQKKICAQFLKEKNKIGAAKASQKIREHEEELGRLV